MGTSLVFLTEGSSEGVVQEAISTKKTPVTESEKTQAKMLKMVSHNPQTQARLFVNANEATQYDDRISLSNPVGTFEKPDGPASLKATQAAYYESNREVHFLKKVSFDHHSGLTATTEHAVLNTKTHDISGNKGVEACHQENKITAKSYEIQTGKNVMSFSGNVCLSISRKNS
jgi:LPS export ABC transporter protein LptC